MLIASIFPNPPRKNTTQLVKYPSILDILDIDSLKPSNKCTCIALLLIGSDGNIFPVTGQCKLEELNAKRTLFQGLDYFNSKEKQPTQFRNLYNTGVGIFPVGEGERLLVFFPWGGGVGGEAPM